MSSAMDPARLPATLPPGQRYRLFAVLGGLYLAQAIPSYLFVAALPPIMREPAPSPVLPLTMIVPRRILSPARAPMLPPITAVPPSMPKRSPGMKPPALSPALPETWMKPPVDPDRIGEFITPMEQMQANSMLRYAAVGSPETVRAALTDFKETAQADELIVVTNTFDPADRIRSYELLADTMRNE